MIRPSQLIIAPSVAGTILIIDSVRDEELDVLAAEKSALREKRKRMSASPLFAPVHHAVQSFNLHARHASVVAEMRVSPTSDC